MSAIESVLIGAFAAAFTWLVTEFVGRPFRIFLDLRREVARRLVEFDNVTARWQLKDQRRVRVDISPSEDARLSDAEKTFRDLASQMRAFAQAEPFALWAVRLIGFEPWETSRMLLALSNEISTSGEGRESPKGRIAKLLRIRPLD
jgi:hypothetical protein